MAYLMSELIAGHTQDNKPLVCVATVELVHLSVVPGCCSSERRHIFNQHHFPSQRGETQRLSRQKLCRQVVEFLHPGSHSSCGRTVGPTRSEHFLSFIRQVEQRRCRQVKQKSCLRHERGVSTRDQMHFLACCFSSTGSAIISKLTYSYRYIRI